MWRSSPLETSAPVVNGPLERTLSERTHVSPTDQSAKVVTFRQAQHPVIKLLENRVSANMPGGGKVNLRAFAILRAHKGRSTRSTIQRPK
jgi:hypothetical protein